MKTKIPYLILTLIICAAQSASAALVFTFLKDDATGYTAITVTGDTATVANQGDGVARDDIGFSTASTGSVRQRGFSRRQDDLSPWGVNYSDFSSIGSGTLTDTISLTSTGISGGSETLIDGYQFDGQNFYLVMGIFDGTSGDGLANNGDTLSFAGSSDTYGLMPVSYLDFMPLLGKTMYQTNDNFQFVFALPEPSSTALLGLGLSSLLLRRRRS
jgi:hypothetical protein